jgi:hypothetical protein
MFFKPDQKLKDLYTKMAELTKTVCLSECLGGRVGSCCSPEYCQMAIDFAKENDIELTETKNAKGCLVEPWLRPLCTLHICERILMRDVDFASKYFDLRDEINIHEDKLYTEQKERG